MNRSSQRGVALVITLIMLSVVTFMAVAFLALSRRERASVTVSTDQTTANLMADTALGRAQAEVVARLMARSNAFQYDFLVSTNFFNPTGFLPGISNVGNVNYSYRSDGQALTEADRIQNIANLQYDPRVPVYVQTNTDVRFPLDFRFFLDFNHNGLFETNGLLSVLDNAGRPIQGLQGFFVGDPEWIGVLERPDLPHSRTNTMVGRYAYLILPEGKSLDLNFIHNQAKRPPNAADDGYWRNQGVGSWENNLAAFFRDLNTNQWTYAYNTNSGTTSIGTSFLDAKDILRYRYTNNYSSLMPVSTLFGAPGANAFQQDKVDGYSDGPLVGPLLSLAVDNDDPIRPWAGSDNPQRYDDLTELFDANKTSIGFTNRLGTTFNPSTKLSSYDRYTFYRLLAQLGVDSEPAWTDKIHLNYRNDPGYSPTNFLPWRPIDFFTNAADRMLRRELGLSVTNIPIYPTNFYSAAVHQLLQLSANIYDATTNRIIGTSSNLPSVFRPVFHNSGSNIVISGYVEATNSDFVGNQWLDLNQLGDRSRLLNDLVRSNANIYGLPIVIGAKKGWPNFNEFALHTAVLVSRKLEVRKATPLSRPTQTNQLYIIGISNLFGVESWNSYTQAHSANVILRITNRFSMWLTNDEPATFAWTNRVGILTNVLVNTWKGHEFKIPLRTNLVFLDNSAYMSRPPRFSTNYVFPVNSGFTVPRWDLTISNRFQYIAVDVPSQRVIDFVNLDNLTTHIDITSALIGNQNLQNQGEPSQVGSFWLTNRIATSGGSANSANALVPTIGVLNQILTSLGQSGNTNNSIWIEYNQDPVAGDTKEKAVELFRAFVGLPQLNPTRFPRDELLQRLGNSVTRQAPFSPVRKLYQYTTWQVNDPLVHYTWEDLYDLERTNNIQYAIPPTMVPTNSNLGQINRRWRPWGGNPNISSDTNAYNLALKDPMVRQSDDWDFPNSKFPSIGWLGRVHRGTPWQTIYFKSTVANTNAWRLWAVNPHTHPTNDWHLPEMFTTAPNANASRGLLSVNQTHIAAWSAVLSGVSVLSNSTVRATSVDSYIPWIIQPDSPQLHAIVDNINLTRLQRPSSAYSYLGEVLAAPALTVTSPYLTPGDPNIPEAVYERIPQQVLSLLKTDDPHVVIYTFGQALRPADRSLVMAPGTPNHLLCTNYQITAEVATKHVLRFDVSPSPTNVVRVITTQERYQYLPLD